MAPERDDFESDFGSETTPTTAATTTTEDPEVVAAREAREAEAERREAEHQARIDECWAQAEAELNTWTDAYNAWLDSTGGQGDYAGLGGRASRAGQPYVRGAMTETEGGQSRKRSRRRGLLLALTALAVLAGAVVGGIALDRTVLDDEPAGISDAEHDRLIDACVGATGGCGPGTLHVMAR